MCAPFSVYVAIDRQMLHKYIEIWIKKKEANYPGARRVGSTTLKSHYTNREHWLVLCTEATLFLNIICNADYINCLCDLSVGNSFDSLVILAVPFRANPSKSNFVLHFIGHWKRGDVLAAFRCLHSWKGVAMDKFYQIHAENVNIIEIRTNCAVGELWVWFFTARRLITFRWNTN